MAPQAHPPDSLAMHSLPVSAVLCWAERIANRRQPAALRTPAALRNLGRFRWPGYVCNGLETCHNFSVLGRLRYHDPPPLSRFPTPVHREIHNCRKAARSLLTKFLPRMIITASRLIEGRLPETVPLGGA